MSVFEDLDQEPDQPRMADLWEWARDDYLAGETADVVCERHRLSRSQFYERARREGWLRRDRPRPRGADATFDAAAQAEAVEAALSRPPVSAYALQRRAWAQAEQAMLAGRRVEAQGWVRLARDLRRMALEEEAAPSWKGLAEAREAAPDSPDSADGPPLPRGGGGLASASRGGGEGAPPPRSGPAGQLPRGAPEGDDPDFPDSGRGRAAPLNRQERRAAAKLARPGLAAAGAGARSEPAWLHLSR